jgi:hypothetical protein
MAMKSLFGEQPVCGVDLSAGKPVRVVGFREKSDVVFQNALELPGNCDVACALPARTSIVRRLSSPFSSLSKTRRVLPSLLDVQMPFSVEECSVSFTRLAKNDDGKIEAVAAAARKVDVQGYITKVAGAGIDPVYLDAEGLALWDGSISELPPVPEEKRAVLKVEEAGMVLCLGEGPLILASHGLTSLDSGHIKRLLSAAFKETAALEWRLAGSLAGEARTKELLDELGDEWVANVVAHVDPEAFLARSLARRAIIGGAGSVNLRQDDLVHLESAATAGSRARALAGVLSICGIALIGLALVLNILIAGKLASLDEEFRSRASALAGGSLGGAKGITALKIAEKTVDGALDNSEPVLSPFKPSLLADVREIAENSHSTGLLIEDLTVTSTTIDLKGMASSWNVPEGLAALFKEKGLTVDLKREESLADESVRFVMKAGGRR